MKIQGKFYVSELVKVFKSIRRFAPVRNLKGQQKGQVLFASVDENGVKVSFEVQSLFGIQRYEIDLIPPNAIQKEFEPLANIGLK